MAKSTFYKDHWINIEEERLEVCEDKFQWREEFEFFFTAAKVSEGQSVIDYGCGPGSIAVELARRVGPEGRVFGIDISPDFIKSGHKKAKTEKLDDRLSFHMIEDNKLPLADNQADRLICKNSLEYVPDLLFTLSEFKRVVKPDGIILAVSSDWGMLVIEPIEQKQLAEIMHAARFAFKDAMIGRKLYNAFKNSGLHDINLQIVTPIDPTGDMAVVFLTMCKYAKEFKELSEEKIDSVITMVNEAIEQDNYLGILPQFVITARV